MKGDTPYETNCVVKYTTWPDAGVTIDNEMGDAAYDGTAADNDYLLQPAGATSFVFNDTTDVITIPHGASIDNLGAFTMEFIVKTAATPTFYPVLFAKGGWGIFEIWLQGFGPYSVGIGRWDTGGALYRRYYSSTTTLLADTYYYIQITWATDPNTRPTIKVNNIAQVLVVVHEDAITSWINDSAYNAQVFTNGTHNQPIVGPVLLFRLHNVALTDAQLIQNYEADKWRYDTNITIANPLVSETTDVEPVGAQSLVCETTFDDTTDNEGVGARVSYPLYTPAAAYETNCVVKYSTWPAAGVTITNEGTGGAPYNGTSADNDYFLLPSSATSFKYNDVTDEVVIPLGAAINNLGAHTMEFIFYFTNNAAYQNLWKKSLYYRIRINPSGQFDLIRYDTTTAKYKRYQSGVVFTTGNWYHVQVAWDATNVANVPTVKINNITRSLTTAHSEPVTAWYNDSASNGELGKDDASVFIDKIALFRIHNIVLTDAQLTQNYRADCWRMSVIDPEINYQDTIDNEGVGAQSLVCETVYDDTINNEGVGAQTLAAPDVNFGVTVGYDGNWLWESLAPTNITEMLSISSIERYIQLMLDAEKEEAFTWDAEYAGD